MSKRKTRIILIIINNISTNWNDCKRLSDVTEDAISDDSWNADYEETPAKIDEDY